MKEDLLTKRKKLKNNEYHIKKGVIIEDISNTYIYENVEIGENTIIHPNTTIKSDVIIRRTLWNRT